MCWPVVYAVDMACDVVAHVEAWVLEMAAFLSGDAKGCFEKPQYRQMPSVSNGYYALISFQASPCICACYMRDYCIHTSD